MVMVPDTGTWKYNEANMQQILTAQDSTFSFLRYAVVPNINGGMYGVRGEVDLLCLSKAGVLHEVEIKVSASDIRADLHKRHKHEHKAVACTWFAVPEELLEKAMQHVPPDFGLVVVRQVCRDGCRYFFTKVVRRPKKRAGVGKITTQQELKLLRLGVMRMWSGRARALGMQVDS